jgi:hypothetical protein
VTRGSAQTSRRADEFWRFRQAIGPIAVNAILQSANGDTRLLDEVTKLIRRKMLSTVSQAVRGESR